MDIGELHHLLFRWLHVVAAVLWIGHIWTLVFAQNAHQPAADAMDARMGRGRMAYGIRASDFRVLRGRSADDARLSPGGWR